MEKTIIKASFESFNTLDMSEEGVKIPLMLPDGTETDQFIIVRGQDSPTFKKASARQARKNFDLLKVKNGKTPLDPADLAMRQERSTSELVATLVSGWSFPQECTIENIVEFFKTAPAIERMVDDVAGERARFFKKPSKS